MRRAIRPGRHAQETARRLERIGFHNVRRVIGAGRGERSLDEEAIA